MGQTRIMKKLIKRFSSATGLSRRESVEFLSQLSSISKAYGLTADDTFVVGADVAEMARSLQSHAASRDLLKSGWESGSMVSAMGTPMRGFAPLDGVLRTADAVCQQFFPEQWREYVQSDPAVLVRLLQEEYAALMAAPLSSEAVRIASIRESLAKLGAEPDEEMVRAERKRFGYPDPGF